MVLFRYITGKLCHEYINVLLFIGFIGVLFSRKEIKQENPFNGLFLLLAIQCLIAAIFV